MNKYMSSEDLENSQRVLRSYSERLLYLLNKGKTVERKVRFSSANFSRSRATATRKAFKRGTSGLHRRLAGLTGRCSCGN